MSFAFRGDRFTPTGALQSQDECASWTGSAIGRSFWTGWYKARTRDHYPIYSIDGAARSRVEYHTLLDASTYLIADDMRMLAEHAALSMPSQPLMEADLPCPSGFMVLERPILAKDVHDKPCSIAAFAWRRADANGPDSRDYTGVLWSYYSDMLDERDFYCAELYRMHPDAESKGTPRLIPVHEDYEHFGAGIAEPEEIAEAAHVPVQQVVDAIRTFRILPVALWALMRQTIAHATEERAHRTVRRQMERAQSAFAASPIRVVRLRREREESEVHAPGSVAWSHRWIVSGHWRNQWLPSIKAHRLQWIAPFTKGPEGKPLVVKRTVHNLVR